MLKFCLKNHSLVQTIPMIQKRRFHSSAIVGDTMAVFGGEDENYNVLDRIEVLNLLPAIPPHDPKCPHSFRPIRAPTCPYGRDAWQTEHASFCPHSLVSRNANDCAHNGTDDTNSHHSLSCPHAQVIVRTIPCPNGPNNMKAPHALHCPHT